MANQSITRGRHSELLVQTALLANGWDVSEPIAPEPFDLVARPPNSRDWLTIQIKTARVRDDRDGAIVVSGKKSNGDVYSKADCDIFAACLNNEIYLFDNRELSEYWVTENSIKTKWEKISTILEEAV